MLLIQFDVKRYDFFAMFGERKLQEWVYRHCPVQQLFVFESRFQSGYLLGKQCFGTYEVYFGKELV